MPKASRIVNYRVNVFENLHRRSLFKRFPHSSLCSKARARGDLMPQRNQLLAQKFICSAILYFISQPYEFETVEIYEKISIMLSKSQAIKS